MNMHLVKKTVWGGLVAASIALLSNIAHSEEQSVKIAYVTGSVDGLVSQLAEEQGIFKKHGLESTLIAVKNGPEMVSAIASGSAEFSTPSPQIALPAIAKGGPIVYLMSNYDLDYSLLARPNVAIDEAAGYPDIIKGLKGMRIGVVGRGGLTELFVRKMFTDAGLNPDTDATIIAVGAGLSAMGAFQNDQVDALVALPPTDIVMPASDFKVVVSNKTAKEKVFGINFFSTGLAANSDFVKGNPVTTLAFCQAFKETIQFINAPENKAAVIGFLSSRLNLNEEQAAKVFEVYGANFNAKLTKDRWDAMKERRDDVPAWETQVYAPCADLSAAN